MKIILILPAYNAEKTLLSILHEFPMEAMKVIDEIILVDDCSKDNTYALANKVKSQKLKIKSTSRNSKVFDIFKAEGRQVPLFSVFQTPRHLGYGGNMKMCLSLALAAGADVIVELHPDGEYMPDGIIPALKEIQKGAKLILGNRFVRKIKNQTSNIKTTNNKSKTIQIPEGMFLWKYVGIKLMNAVDTILLGTDIPDLHQGFRVYTKELLESINFRSFSNDYLFSFEMILTANKQQITNNNKIFECPPISSVPVTAIYKGKKRGASMRNSLIYSFGTILVILKYLFFKLLKVEDPSTHPDKHRGSVGMTKCPICNNNYFVTLDYKLRTTNYELYSCCGCQNGFTFPVPKMMDQFYPSSYWQYKSLIGLIRQISFSLFQKRRVRWVKEMFQPRKERPCEAKNILDVGSGEGTFGKQVQRSKIKDQSYNLKVKTSCHFEITNIEPKFSKVKNPDVIKTDFLTWETKKKFDAVTFWESLEHVPDPLLYLKKAHQLLKKDGLLFIEYPQNDVIESRLFGRYWFHLDIPRHLTHFSQPGLTHALRQKCNYRLDPRLRGDDCGFKIIYSKSVMSYEYAPGGLYLSMTNYNLSFTWLFIPLFPLCFVLEIMFYIIGQSPIGLVIAQKKYE